MAKRSVRVTYLMLGLVALWFIPAVANAQVTITSVKVTESGKFATAVWCDTSLACNTTGGLAIWDLKGGITVGGGETLVLAQTGRVPTTDFGNFDTSDRAELIVRECTSTGSVDFAKDPCTTTIEINGIQVYQSAAGDALNFNNKDIVGNNSKNEWSPWAVAAIKPNYTLSLGYADNEHTSCPGTACFPSPFSGDLVIGLTGSFLNCSSNCFDSGALLITGIGAPATATGRMTGGGSVFTRDGTRVTHGFELHCDVTDVPNTLEINWPPANNFHLDVLATAVCTDDPQIIQAPPVAPFDTFKGTGTGKLNNVPGASIVFTLVDAGEPGIKDTAAYVIKDKDGNTVLTVPTAFLTKGNQQAHKDNK